MSVAPDFLLQSAPDTRPKAAAAKPPTNSSEPRQNKASSFSDVYAKERQSKASERKDDATKMAKASGEPAASKSAAPTTAAADKPAIAESGKVLPDDEVDKESDVTDPLLLLGLNPLLPQEGSLPETEAPTDTLDALLPGGAGALLASTGLTGVVADVSQEPELDVLDSLPGMRQALEMGVQGQQPLSPGALAAQKAVDPTEEDFNSKFAALSDIFGESKEGKDEPVSGERLTNALELEQPKGRETPSDARADALASRLSALSQAISQQSNVAARAQLIPGQPLAMQQGAWSEAVVDRVMWLSSQNLKSAEIQLDPAELGRMEVRIDMRQDQTQVTFISAHAGVREQLEGQVHRLREMFIQQGMDQPNVNVGDQSMSRGWQGGDDGRQQARGGNSSAENNDDEQLIGMSEIRAGGAATSRGLVDYYA